MCRLLDAWRPWRGMIRRNMGLTFEGSRKIAARKSEAMVGYLRARRACADPSMHMFLKLHQDARARSRQAHFRIVRGGKP
jgi:hypothetical protein